MAIKIADSLARIQTKMAGKRLTLNPPSPLEDIELWESTYGVRLPEEYRQFILQIGNGGDGPPSYGLLDSGTLPSGFGRSAGEDLKNLAKPFPFTEPWIWENDEHVDEKKKDQTDYGRLILGDEGCGRYWALIVTGPSRGKMWDITDVGIQPCDPPKNFLEWYESWLDGNTDCGRLYGANI